MRDRRRYFVTPSLICWVQASNHPWYCLQNDSHKHGTEVTLWTTKVTRFSTSSSQASYGVSIARIFFLSTSVHIMTWSPFGKKPLLLNPLWPSDPIYQQRSGSILIQEMACSLMTPSFFLKLLSNFHQWGSVEFTWGHFDMKSSRYHSINRRVSC